MTVRRVPACVLAAVAGLAATDAAASGFQLRENSASAVGTAFAGAASAAEDVSTIYNNPAGMTYLEGNQAAIVGTIVVPSSTFSGSATFSTGVPTGGATNVDAGTAAIVPAAYALLSVTNDLKFGLAVSSPFGLKSTYPDTWAGRYQAIDSELTSININPNIAYRVLPWLSIGGGVSAEHVDAKLSNALSLGAAGDAIATIKGDSWGYGFNLGALAEPIKGTRIGLTYRSQVYHRIEGDVTFQSPVPVAAFFNSSVSIEDRTPDVATLSVTQQLTPELAVMAEGQWTHWSVFKNLTAIRSTGAVLSTKAENWGDAWFTALGARWQPTGSDWTFRTGAAYDWSPVGDTDRTARIPDSDRFWLAVGAGYRLSPAVTLDAGYSHIFMRNAAVGESTVQPTGVTSTLIGTYKSEIDILSLQAVLRF